MAYLSFKSKLWISLTTMAALVLLTGSSAVPVSGEIDKAIAYLTQYGYLNPSLSNPSSGNMMAMRHAIAEFQSFAGLNATGELDEETTKLMSFPRCGVPDKVFGSSRTKRYVLEGSRWRKRRLTYKISKYPSGSRLSHATVDAEIARAFSVWSRYADLTFTRKRSGRTDIDIRFEKGDHGDGDAFDGPALDYDGIGETLAHAFFPSGVNRGKVHFDDDEPWTTNSYDGWNLFQSAVHEFGHMLGLMHNYKYQSVMYYTTKPYQPNFHLDQDDIKGIQALYGPKKNKKQKSYGRWRW